MLNQLYLQAGIFETEGRSSVAAGRDELRGCLSALTAQEEDAAVVESPAGVAPPLLCQVVRLLSPANSRFVILTQALSLEASARQEAALSMKLLLVDHCWEGTACVEVREEDLRTRDTGASVTRPVDTSSQQNSWKISEE